MGSLFCSRNRTVLFCFVAEIEPGYLFCGRNRTGVELGSLFCGWSRTRFFVLQQE